MSMVSLSLRRDERGFSHWCPGCEETHLIPDSWTFDGRTGEPTFLPSVKHTGVQTVVVDGEWNGEWRRNEKGEPLAYCCHYFVTRGMLEFLGDCTHALKGMTVPLPVIPAKFRDAG